MSELAWTAVGFVAVLASYCVVAVTGYICGAVSRIAPFEIGRQVGRLEVREPRQ